MAKHQGAPMGETETGTGPRTATFNILFVCTGNTCRSPLAEAIARRELERRGWPHVRVASAGVSAQGGSPASANARTVGRRHEVALEAHRSRALTADLVAWADLVLGMGPGHLDGVARLGGEEKMRTLGDFAAGDARGRSVADPFGGPESAYEETYAELEALVGRALDRLAPILHP
jgi:protein-tyrosine phosphatase